MTLIQGIILGLVQGLTEFLPVSSSAHLVIFEKILNVEAHTVAFEVLLHVGTLLAVIIYFRRQLYRIFSVIFKAIFTSNRNFQDKDLRLAWYLVIGTFPAALAGYFLKKYFEEAFAAPRWAAGMLLITALILILTRWVQDKNNKLNSWRAILIGIAQAVAIMPGISRSGSTISTGMYVGLNKSEAAEFAFLLSIPVIGGAALLEVHDFIRILSSKSLSEVYIIGALVAAVIGYFSIAYLLSVVKKGKFFYFGVYCAVVGILGLLLL
jgi:undecaprenyl-diphosphatase